MSNRCEPPEHLRDVDGWHWVENRNNHRFCTGWLTVRHKKGGIVVRRWHGKRSIWTAEVLAEWGYHYVAPVATPEEVATLRAEVERLREALGKFAEADSEPGAELTLVVVAKTARAALGGTDGC